MDWNAWQVNDEDKCLQWLFFVWEAAVTDSDAIIYCYGQSEEGRCSVCLVAGITFSDASNTLGVCMPIISR